MTQKTSTPVSRIRDIIDEVADVEVNASSTEQREGAQRILELIFVWLMNRLGPIWHRTKRTLMNSPAFDCFLKWFPTMAVEMLPLRRNPQTDTIELLMFPRSPVVGPGNPPEYAGRLHSPGCMLMWGMTIREGLDRAVAKETGARYQVIAGLPVNLDTTNSPRGYEVALGFIVQLSDELPANSAGVWIPIDRLGELYSQKKIIEAQFEHFLEGLVVWAHANQEKIS